MASIPPSASATAAAAASTMRTVTLSLLTHASPSPALPTLAQALSSLATPSIAVATNAATTSSPPPSDQDFDMGSLPWPPLWLTVCAFALTLVATVMGVGVWLISSPPRYAGCVGDCVCGGEEDGGKEKEGWQGKGEEEELEEEWDSDGDEDEDNDAVELKRLLSDAPSKLNHHPRRVENRNSKNLRLDLTAAAGLSVGSWGRDDAGYDGINDDVEHDVWEHKCRDYGVERHHHDDDDDDDETASLVSLSLASCSSSSSSCTANRIPNANTPGGRRSATSTSTKPVFNQPLRGWRKAVDDRVCALACWIEAYVADGGREKDLLGKITREERGDVVYGFEY